MPKLFANSVALVFVATSVAQAPSSGGPLAGAALAFAVDGGLSGGVDATTYVHRSGFVGAPGVFGANGPNLAAILAGLGAPAGLDYDDFTMGRDDVLVDGNGVVDVPPGAWGMFSFSFRNPAAGQQLGRPGTRLRTVASGSGGASVFTWVLPGSDVPAGVIDRVERSHARTELGLSSATAEVDGIDVPAVLGFEQRNLNARDPVLAPLLPTAEVVYFTLSSASAAVAPAAWFPARGGLPTRSGASILMVMRSSLQGGWTGPFLWKAYFELGITAAQDVDALAYDAAADKLLFSTVGTTPDPLLLVDFSTDGGGATPKIVKMPDGVTPVTQAIGTAQGDDIDAVCTLDPQLRSQFWVPDDFGASVGTPRPANQPGLYPVGMSASACRRYELGQTVFDTWLVGYPPATGVGPGFAVLGITLGDTLAPMITASFQARVPTSAVAGDPRHYAQGIPPSYALQGIGVTFRWYAADAGLVQLAQAYPLKVFL